MYKALVHVGFILLYALVLFFGFGPVLLADGTHGERAATSVIVFAAAILLIAAHIWLMRRLKS